jgi:hypothetical protein
MAATMAPSMWPLLPISKSQGLHAYAPTRVTAIRGGAAAQRDASQDRDRFAATSAAFIVVTLSCRRVTTKKKT